MKLLLDANLSPRWVDLLNREGFEATHWSAVGPGDAPDSAIMAFARTGGHVVLTHDLDFGAALAFTLETGPSVVQIRGRKINPDVIGIIVVRSLRQASRELGAGALLTIDPGGTRLRLLPLRRDGRHE